MNRFRGSDGTEFGTDLVLRKHLEADVLVKGSIPGNFSEGGQRDRPPPGLTGPRAHAVKEGSAHAEALVIWPDAHLLDVSVAVDHIHDHVTHRFIRRIDGNPSPAFEHVMPKTFD
jgi:hypothetical protein